MQELKRYYQFGSVAEAPERILDDPYYEQRKKDEKRKKILEQKARRRAHKRSLREARIKLFSTTLTIGILISMLFASVYLQNMVSQSKKNIAALQREISDIKMTNEAAKSRIETAVSLTNVKDKAVKEMGMVYAGSDHIVYYEMGNTDYMVKY